jgi:hypothetical protein
VKRGCVNICAAILALAPAIGQQPPASVRIGGPGVIGALGRAVKDSRAADLTPDVTRPKWSSNFTFNPNTALTVHSAVFDPATNVMIVFGGGDLGMEYFGTNAVLLYAPANVTGAFSTLIPNGAAGAPTARVEHSAVYDTADNLMIVFGGVNYEESTVFNDVWVLSHANGHGGTPVWTQLSPSGSPPAPRFAHTAVYDARKNRMIIFGGYNGSYFSDVWVLSHANGLGGMPEWTQLSPSGTPPDGVNSASAVYDPANDIMVVFGGEDNTATAYSNSVWTLSHASGLGGSPQWTNIVADGATGSPAQRALHSAVYDATNNRMMIFGGDEFSGFVSHMGLNDVWVLANANGLGGTPAWTQLKPAGGLPGPRYAQTAVYDARTNQMIICAGQNGEGQYFVVWVLSDANGL